MYHDAYHIVSADEEKKERVIHTRVSESLEQELKKRAGSLGVSVSNLVRNVLANTFGLVEAIVSDSASVARAARGEAEPAAPGGAAPGPVLLGWQELTLVLNALCDRCNAILPRGARAAAAVYDRPGPRAFLCSACLEEIRHADAPSRSG